VKEGWGTRIRDDGGGGEDREDILDRDGIRDAEKR